MYVYRYRDKFLVLKMTIKVLLGLLLLSPVLGLVFGKKQYIELFYCENPQAMKAIPDSLKKLFDFQDGNAYSFFLNKNENY